METQELAFPAILVKLRKQKHLTQPEFANQLSLLVNRNTKFAISTISSWELGTKMPNLDVLMAIADLFGVSTDYLLGHKPTTKKGRPKSLITKYELIEISTKSISKHAGEPIYLRFNNENIPDQWCIYNEETKQFIGKSTAYNLNSDSFKMYTIPVIN